MTTEDLNRGKFKEMVLFFAERSAERGDSGFGMVKLNKLLYRADFEAFRKLGHSITGETYERQDFGPVARSLPIVLDELGASGRLRWDTISTDRYTQYVPKVPSDEQARPDKTVFTKAELAVMDEAVLELAGLGGKAASNWSHDESAGWNVAAENGVAIEYSTAIISTKSIPPEDLKRASEFVRDRGWVKAS